MSLQDEQRDAILSVIRAIPPGKVLSYGDVAAIAGAGKAARWVAKLLKQYSRSHKLPWHRVLRADGTLAFPAESVSAVVQAQKLASEGVVTAGKRYKMSHYRWREGK